MDLKIQHTTKERTLDRERKNMELEKEREKLELEQESEWSYIERLNESRENRKRNIGARDTEIDIVLSLTR